jgi:hypothetical protein
MACPSSHTLANRSSPSASLTDARWRARRAEIACRVPIEVVEETLVPFRALLR